MRPLPTQFLSVLSISWLRADKPVSFNDDVRPLMSETCYHCHGPDGGTREPKDEPLRLDRAEFSLAKRANAEPVKAHRQLKPTELKLIDRWVRKDARFEEHWAFVTPV